MDSLSPQSERHKLSSSRSNTAICEQCGTEFPCRPSRIRKGAGHFCSRKCKGLASRKSHFIEHHGIEYHRNIHGYYVTHTQPELKLHRVIWEEHYGAIPEGYHIHHKDHNPANNVIENLQLMSPSEHATHHHHGKVGIKQPKKLCTAPEGCDKFAIAKGLCPKHYMRVKSGYPNKLGRPPRKQQSI